MVRFNVNMTKVPWMELGKTPVIFHVRQGEDDLGILRVRKGCLVWVPPAGQHGYWLEWNKFAKMAAKNGRKKPAGV